MTEVTLETIVKEFSTPTGVVRAVDHVSLSVRSGELFFLLGPSGCGKTTLLRIVAGLIAPTSGRVLFDSHDVTGLSVEDRYTAMVFQNYALWPHMTVRQNVEFGPRMRRAPRPNDEKSSRSTSPACRWSSSPGASPISFPAGSSSAWPWPAPWLRAAGVCCWMSR